MRSDLASCVVSVSGIRGIVGPAMNPSLMCALGAAVGRRLAKGKGVVLGRDSRDSGPLLADALASGLRGVGCEVIDLGIVPTPTVPLMVRRLRAGAGVQISASHNPEPWNALKIYTRRGRNVDGDELEQVLALMASPPADLWVGHQALGQRRDQPDAIALHCRAVLDTVDLARLHKRRLRVVVDSVNGAGAVIAPQLLEQLGCEVIPIYDRPDRPFPRDPEPTAANVTETGAMVKALGADLGFVQDPDADRLAIIDERGRYIGEEYTLVLCAAARFSAADVGPDAVAVTNLSTSRMLEDVAARHGAQVIRTRVGEAHVLDAMQASQALIGGEGNGGVVDPRVVFCRDSQAAMALVLDYCARREKPLSHLLAEIPSYAMHKEKVGLDRAAVAAAIAQVLESPLVQGAVIDVQDGLKLIWPDSWLHLRASGTEPAARIISEAPSAAAARKLAGQLRGLIKAPLLKAGHH
ncbi:MAG: phosphoglucosamine mutase [Planctomycetota bacterium]|nr:MAG: phosphoglucosamine mutase [Planctomycetota bacterium]